jgi:hypothetical protein
MNPAKPTAPAPAASAPAEQPVQKKAGGGGASILLVITALLAAGAAVLFSDDIRVLLIPPPAPALSSAPYPKVFPTHTIVGEVPREAWDPKKPVAAPLLANATAKVLTNTFVSAWPAMKKWDLYSSYFPTRLPPLLTSIYRSTNAYFGPLYRGHKPMAKLPGASWANPHEVVHMDTHRFFDHVSGRVSPVDGNGTRTWLYYTGDLNAPFLAKDLEPWRELIPRPEGQRVNVWVSDQGVTTHLHVDAFDNFFVQIQGTKRMVLFPPQETLNAPLYPFIHPSFGQAHVHLPGTPTLAKYANTPMAHRQRSPAAAAVARTAARLARAARRVVHAVVVGTTDTVAAAVAAVAGPETDIARRVAAAAAAVASGSVGPRAAARAAAAADASSTSADEDEEDADDAAPREPVYKTAPTALTGPKYPSETASMAGEAARLPRSGALKGYEVLLGPGDLLFIPPNWGHYVETLSPSISVNFWTAARSQARYDAAMKHVVSTAVHDWTIAQKRFAVALIVNGVLTEPQVYSGLAGVAGATGVGGDGTVVRRFIEKHVLARYEPLIAAGDIDIMAKDTEECGFEPHLTLGPEGSARGHAQMLQLVGVLPADAELPPEGLGADDEDEDGAAAAAAAAAMTPEERAAAAVNKVYRALGEVAARVAKEFAQVPAVERHVWLGNFVDTLAYWASDALGRQTATVVHCLANYPIGVTRG